MPFVFLLVVLSVSLASTRAFAVEAQIKVSVTVGESSSPELPDFQEWFERFFGGSNPENHQVTSTSDYDGDGQLDYLEYYAGTNPTDGASMLKIENVELSGNDAEITWTSTASVNPEPRKYRIFRSGPDALGVLADSDATILSLQGEALITDLGEVESMGATTFDTDANVKSQFPLFYRVFLSKPEPQVPNP